MEDKKKDKPKIPSLKDSTRPQVKIKGIGGKLSLVERLKQFKKKDLAFIAAGLGVLFMAPLAEHFMMSPETAETGAFKEGWGFHNAAGGFGSGGFPYEGGYNNLAPGNLLGGEADVITPLNVRDPAALVMGPGGMKAKPVSQPAPTKSSASPDWKDALAAAASKASSEVKKSARLPVPKIPFKGGLRGLGAISGGGGGSYTLPKLSAANVPNRAAGSNSLSRVKTATGYRGTAGMRGRNNASSGALENLKKAATNAGREMNRGGSAAGNLETTAAASSMPGGAGSSLGGRGTGAKDKGPGGSSSGGNARSGNSESLAFQLKKKRMNMELANEMKQKFADENFWPDMKRELTKTGLTTLTKGLTDGLVKLLTGAGTSASAVKGVACSLPKRIDFPAMPACNDRGKDPSGYCLGSCPPNTPGNTYVNDCVIDGGNPKAWDCWSIGGVTDDSTSRTRTQPTTADLEKVEKERKADRRNQKYSSKQNLDGVCQGIIDHKEGTLEDKDYKGDKDDLPTLLAYMDKLVVAGRQIAVARDVISLDASDDCKEGDIESIKPQYGDHIYDIQKKASVDLGGMQCQMRKALETAYGGINGTRSNYKTGSDAVVVTLNCGVKGTKDCLEANRTGTNGVYAQTPKIFNGQLTDLVNTLQPEWKSLYDGKEVGEKCPAELTKPDSVENHLAHFTEKFGEAKKQIEEAKRLLGLADTFLGKAPPDGGKPLNSNEAALSEGPQKFVADLRSFLAKEKADVESGAAFKMQAALESKGKEIKNVKLDADRYLADSGKRVEEVEEYVEDMATPKEAAQTGVFNKVLVAVVDIKYKDGTYVELVPPQGEGNPDWDQGPKDGVINEDDYNFAQAKFKTAKDEFERKTGLLLPRLEKTAQELLKTENDAIRFKRPKHEEKKAEGTGSAK